MILAHLLRCLSKGRWRWERLGHTFAFDFPQQTELRMPLTVGLSAVTFRLSTAAGNRGDRTRAEVAQAKKLPQKFGTSGLKLGQRLGHKSPPSLSIYIRSDQKRFTPILKARHFYVAHPRPNGRLTMAGRA